MGSLTTVIERIAAELHANGVKALHLADEHQKAYVVAEYAAWMDYDIEILYSLRELNDAIALGQDFEGFHRANLYAVVEGAIGEQIDEWLRRLRREAAREWAMEQRMRRAAS